jgi:hypothetical protein
VETNGDDVTPDQLTELYKQALRECERSRYLEELRRAGHGQVMGEVARELSYARTMHDDARARAGLGAMEFDWGLVDDYRKFEDGKEA